MTRTAAILTLLVSVAGHPAEPQAFRLTQSSPAWANVLGKILDGTQPHFPISVTLALRLTQSRFEASTTMLSAR